MNLPTVDFLGIGAQRAATTWLHSNLRTHPQIFVPWMKELHYFDIRAGLDTAPPRISSVWSGLLRRGPAEREWRSRFWRNARTAISYGPSSAMIRDLSEIASYHLAVQKNDDWYRRQFLPGTGRVKGEITPAYALLDDATVSHVTTMFPDVKVIFILRDPVSRTLSALRRLWDTCTRRGDVPPDPLEFAASPAVHTRNDYLRSIDTWSRHVPAERFFIGWHDDIVADPAGTIRKVLEFLGVDPTRPGMLQAAKERIHVPTSRNVPPEVGRAIARSSRPGIAALAARCGGHADVWLERCDAIIAGTLTPMADGPMD